MIPGLERAEFVRFGVMHRNTYLQAAKVLDRYYRMKKYPKIYFAGQLSGVEGYVESASSGILAGLNLANQLQGMPMLEPDRKTAIGSLPLYITEQPAERQQPMNANFGIIEGLEKRVRGKKTERYRMIAERSLKIIQEGMTRNEE